MWDRGFVLVPLADLAPEIVAGRLDDVMRAGVELAGTLGPGQRSPTPPGAGRAGQDRVRQGYGRQEQGCQER